MTTEQRLRDAFAALADTVDTEARPRRVRHRWALPALAALLIVIAMAGVLIFVRPAADQVATPRPTPVTLPPSTTTVTVSALPWELYTHCGVREVKIGSVYFTADTPIPDPAQGWDNPYQLGTMTLLSPATAEFRDDRGHVVRFHARPGGMDPAMICM
jgi:hypothetical protein